MPIEPQLGRPHTPGCDCDNPQCERNRDNEREMLEVVGGVMPIDNIRQWITAQMNKAERMHCCNGISEYRASVMIADLFIEKQKELDAKDAEIQKLKSAKVSVTVVSEFDPHRRIFGEIVEIENDVILVEGEWND